MPLKAYEDWAPEPLAFPIKGKVYEVPPLSWEAGVKLTAIMRDTEDAPDDPDEQNRLLMGDLWDQMKADGVPAEALSRAALTCLVDFRMGRDAAVKVWESGLTPEALAPAVGASTSTGAETTTPTPDSTSGTTSPKASTKRKRASRSTKSSTSAS